MTHLDLIQGHTKKIYDLEHKPVSVERVKARDLLSVRRFDLFAKLCYIRHRQTDPDMARRVYAEHIIAFNPDLREPGRDDKAGLDVFFSTFDALIDEFATQDFDDTKSIVPVSEDGIILDGAHRVAALAYYDREVTVARFAEVRPIAEFDYRYFRMRSLDEDVCDLIAIEMCRWVDDMRVACLWPRMGGKDAKDRAEAILSRHCQLAYTKELKVNLKSLVRFVAAIYEAQGWVGDESNGYAGARDKASNCMAANHGLRIVIFDGAGHDVVAIKDEIRSHYTVDKHCIHITDNQQESIQVASLALDPGQRARWKQGASPLSMTALSDMLRERYDLFRIVTLPKIKTRIYKIIVRR